jgi:hypothetical protein
MSLPSSVIRYGGVPVPFTVAWSAEIVMVVRRCPYAGRPAICQQDARGIGKPRFGSPHADRQRQVIALDLCDLCAKPLKARTKVSLSHARAQLHGAHGGDILQVEPMLHRECAAISLAHCPALKRDLREGSLRVRQVTRHRVQFAMMSPEYVLQTAGQEIKAVGHAKVELLAWTDRDEAWLEAAA